MKKATETKLKVPMSLLLLGAPGTGKTSLASQFPKCFILNVDNNIDGPIRFLKKRDDANLDFMYADTATCDSEETLKAVGCKTSDIEKFEKIFDVWIIPRDWRYRLAAYWLEKAMADPDIDTIVLDSFTSMNDILMDEVRRQYNLPFDKESGKVTRRVDKRPEKDGYAMWDGYMKLAKNLILELRGCGKRLIAIGHITTKEDEAKNLRKFIAIPGQFGEQISGYFEEVWLLQSETKFKSGKEVQTRTIKTQAPAEGQALGLKSASQLPVTYQLDDYKDLIKQLS